MKRIAAVTIGFVVSLALAVLVGSSPVTVADGNADGRAVFEAQKCNTCHAVEALGIEAKSKSAAMAGSDLSVVATDADTLTKYLRKEAQINDKDHKKDLKITDDELKALVDWLRSAKS